MEAPFEREAQADMHEFMFAIVETNPARFSFTLVTTTEDGEGARVANEPATSLALPLGQVQTPTSVVELLGKYIQPEPLEGDQWRRRTMVIGNTPQILAVQLVRFTRTKTETRKNNREVAFDETLDLGPYTESGAEARYDLIAVAIHRGTFGGGHYWAFTKKEEGWTKYDDNSTTRADFADVRRASNGDSTAYVLVYRRAAIK
jgi:ubiquitin C-terminal hydrolase